ncbi:MAG: hypothetical protein QM756_03835 [Polyangiaceae bacterium]
MRKGTALAIAICSVVTAWAHSAAAEKVALIRPHEETGVLSDAFNRLQAELRIHHLDSTVVDVEVGDAPVERLAEIAQQAGALASIAFVQHGNTASVDVWLLDRMSGKTTMRRLEVGRSSDAASVLAFRAVDLLRTSLQEYQQGEAPPRDVVGVDRRPLPPEVRKLAAPRAPLLRLRAEGIAVYDGKSLGFAYGPALGVHGVFRRLELGVMFAGPLIGAKFEANGGTASTRQELAFANARLSLVSGERLGAGIDLSVGAHFMQAEGQANAPLVSVSDSVYGGFGSLGLQGELFLSHATALTFSMRALALMPRQGVAVLAERMLVSQPLLQAGLGIAVGL